MLIHTFVENINNDDERRQCRRSSFGCHVAGSDVAPCIHRVDVAGARSPGDVALPGCCCCGVVGRRMSTTAAVGGDDGDGGDVATVVGVGVVDGGGGGGWGRKS